jgi:predicted TIM-barrel fold metal-dependent hydrolase
MKIIDAHTHVAPQYAGLAVEAMDRCGIDCAVTLEMHDGIGDRLKEHLAVFAAYPGRFIVFGNVDWSRIDEARFGQAAAEQMERDVAAGMRGLKVYKALGLEYKYQNGDWVRIDDPALDPIWAQAGELGIPVLIHCADPAPFWAPITANSFWDGVLYGEYEWWTYYRQDYPSREALLGERNEVIARHPHTTFICPHVGSKADCLDSAADDLDAWPNLYYDLSARIPTLGMSKRRAAHSRAFLIQYQNRILFGTDIIYDDTNVPTGMQAQCLYQPGEFPLAGRDPEKKYVETTVAFFASHLEFLTTSHVQTDPPFRRSRNGFSIAGLDLPAEVCEKILYRNASRLLGLG